MFQRIYHICPYFVKKIFIFGETDRHSKSIQKLKSELKGRIQIIEYQNGLLDLKAISREINMEILEKKYGGEMADLSEFWPPRCTVDATKSLDDDTLLQSSIIPFTFNKDKFKDYKETLKYNTARNSSKRETYGKIFTPRSQHNTTPSYLLEEGESTAHSWFHKKSIMLKRQKSSFANYASSNKKHNFMDLLKMNEIDEETGNSNSLSKNMSRFNNRELKKKSLERISLRRKYNCKRNLTKLNFDFSEDEANVVEDDSMDSFNVKAIPSLEFGPNKKTSKFKKNNGASGGIWGLLNCCTRRFMGDME